MKRLALLLPLLALAAAPARAEDPATDAAPALEEVEGPVVSVRPEDFVEDDVEDVERFPRPGLAGHRALHAHWTRVVREWGREPRPGDRAAALAMRWLESRQGADGSWGGGDVSATSLALLVRLRTPADAFLEAVPPRDARADAAARFLLSSLGPDGAFRPADADGFAQALGLLALAEAWHGAGHDPAVRTAVTNAAAALLAAARPDGAWSAGLADAPPGAPPDPALTALCVEALRAAKAARPVPYAERDDVLLSRAGAFDGFLRNGGPFPDFATAAAAAATLPLLGVKADDPRLAAARSETVPADRRHKPAFPPPGRPRSPFLAFYLASCARHEAGRFRHCLEPDDATVAALLPAMAEEPVPDAASDDPILVAPGLRGWWGPDPDDGYLLSPGAAPDAPRVRDTCLACLALSAPYDRARVTDDPWEYSGLPSRRSVSGIEYLYSPTNRLGEIDVIQHRPGARSPVVTPVPTTNGTVRKKLTRSDPPFSPAPAVPAPHAESADGAKEPAP